jgi:hypothetical protein
VRLKTKIIVSLIPAKCLPTQIEECKCGQRLRIELYNYWVNKCKCVLGALEVQLLCVWTAHCLTATHVRGTAAVCMNSSLSHSYTQTHNSVSTAVTLPCVFG